MPTAQRAALVAGVQVFNPACFLGAFDWVLTLILQLPVYDASKAQLLAHGVKDGAGCHLAARWSTLGFLTHSLCLLRPTLIFVFP